MSDIAVNKEVFVGREAERNEFHELLRLEGTGYSIYHLYGDGGIGKTRLLHWCIKESDRLNQIMTGEWVPEEGSLLEQTAQHLSTRGLQQVLVTGDLIDFYKTGVHTLDGLLKEIVRQIGPQYFDRFQELLPVLEQETSPTKHKDLIERLREAFSEGCQALSAKAMIILLFDTFEAAGWLGENLLREVLPGFTQNTMVVVVGRKRADFLSNQKTAVRIHPITPFSPLEAVELFRQRGLSEEIVQDDQVKQISEMVRGRPIYLMLAADWIENGEGSVEGLIEPNDDLGRALVRRILRLFDLESQAILYLAWIWRWGNPALLAHLLEISLEDVDKLITGLSRFSFIKYRPPVRSNHPDGKDYAGNCLLHDEMRDLVQLYCWDELDRTGGQRRYLNEMAIKYYERYLLEREGEEVTRGLRRANSSESRNYQAEWVYYLLRHDFARGCEVVGSLFHDAYEKHDISFCQQLLDEFSRPEFEAKISPSDWAEYRFRQGLLWYQRERYKEAEQNWQKTISPNPPNPKIQASSLKWLVEMSGDTGRVSEGMVYAEKAEAAYQKLIEQEPGNVVLKRELGEVFNNWGRLYRIKGNLLEAAKYYRRAIDMYKDLPEAEVNKGRARTINNLGFVYRELGDLNQAKTLCGLALHIRRRINNKYELGLSFNTLGMVLEEDGNLSDAANSYYRALEIFDEIESQYGRGLALINRGRLYRSINDFDKAYEVLTVAKNIFEKVGNREQLAQALHELGCVYRGRRKPGDRELAKEAFECCIELAESYSGNYLVANTLIELARMYERSQQVEEAKQMLEKAEIIIDQNAFYYLMSLTSWVRANIFFEEGIQLEKGGKHPEAQSYFHKAFQLYIDSVASCINQEGSNFTSRRAERHYYHVLDFIQGRLHSRPSAEVYSYAEILINSWRERGYTDRFNDLIKLCELSKSVANHL